MGDWYMDEQRKLLAKFRSPAYMGYPAVIKETDKKQDIMTESEKAKAYDETLEKAKTMHKMACEMHYENTRIALEELYPILKESEDERMRKRIIKILQQVVPDPNTYHTEIAWLEKHKNKFSDHENNICS